MLGKPKYKYGDKVSFTIEGKKITGEVYIIDEYGTFFDKSDVSYDIMCDNILYKHVNEKLVTDGKE